MIKSWNIKITSSLLLILYSLVGIYGCSTAQKQQQVIQKINVPPPAVQEAAFNKPLKKLPEKEILVFKIKYLGIIIGTLTSTIKGIENYHGRDAYVIECVAETDRKSVV